MPPELTQYGFPGLVIFVLSGVVAYQQKRLDAKDSRIESITEARLADIKSMTEKYEKVMEAFAQNSQLILAKLSGKEG